MAMRKVKLSGASDQVPVASSTKRLAMLLLETENRELETDLNATPL
jgi:hypothetical protein